MLRDLVYEAWRRDVTAIFLLCLLALLALSAVVVALAAAQAAKADRAWRAWAAEHCEVIGSMSGDTIMRYQPGANGTVLMIPHKTSGKTGYRCDDGLEYWR